MLSLKPKLDFRFFSPTNDSFSKVPSKHSHSTTMVWKFSMQCQRTSLLSPIITWEYAELAKSDCAGYFDGLKQGGSKNGQRTFGIFWEDCYAREISCFVCNKVRLF